MQKEGVISARENTRNTTGETHTHTEILTEKQEKDKPQSIIRNTDLWGKKKAGLGAGMKVRFSK